MSFLFIVQDKLVAPNPETLLIDPFKTIWERDKTKSKEVATQEFTYIEFMASMKKSNPFKGYGENIKESKIRESVIKIKNWSPDNFVKQGIVELKKFQTEASATYSYYISVKNATEGMQEFLNNVDLSERNAKTGTPIYKPKEVTSALIDTEKVLTNLKNIEVKVEEELFESTKTRGQKEISYFADAESFK